MYTVYLYNFGWELEAQFKTYTAAMKKAIDTGFDCVIRKDGIDIETIRSI